MNESLEQSTRPEKPELRQLMDPTPPVPDEERLDSDGNEWVWKPSHHTVARELEINASNGNYWEERLKTNSDDAEGVMRDAENVDEEKAKNSIFGDLAYHWQIKH